MAWICPKCERSYGGDPRLRPPYVCKNCRQETRREKQSLKARGKVVPKHDGKQLRTMPYAEFLRTSYWREVRRLKIRQVGGRCEHCKTRGSFQVHHRDYKYRGNEHKHLDCLVVLCGKCHEFRHNLDIECPAIV